MGPLGLTGQEYGKLGVRIVFFHTEDGKFFREQPFKQAIA
jgi:hypothetical protein